MQGYLFARPMRNLNVSTFIAELEERSRPPAFAVR